MTEEIELHESEEGYMFSIKKKKNHLIDFCISLRNSHLDNIYTHIYHILHNYETCFGKTISTVIR